MRMGTRILSVLLMTVLTGCMPDDRHITYMTIPEHKVYVMDQKDLEKIWAKIPEAYGLCPRAFTWHNKVFLAATMNGSQAQLERQWGHEEMHLAVGRNGERLKHPTDGVHDSEWDLTYLFKKYGAKP
jgi:hypothetical protein